MTAKSTVKPRLPRGLIDRDARDLAATRAMMEKIREVYTRYGFAEVETPFIEYTEALGKFLPDQDRPNEGVFSFQDDDEQWLSLRYDLTAPLARYVAENFDALPKPYRSYRAGYVFRNEKPGPGRFRQFMQFDADTVGAASVAADAEICMMAADTLHNLGIHRPTDANKYEEPSYLIKVNNRKILDGLMDAIGLSGVENEARRLTVLRTIDKLDRFPPDEIRKLLGVERRDQSGDVTKGADLGDEQIDKLLKFLIAGHLTDETAMASPLEDTKASDKFFRYSDAAIVKNSHALDQMAAQFDNEVFNQGISELRQMVNIFSSLGYNEDRIRIDPSVVRGLEYYTGPVFEAELTFEVKGDDGKPVRFGSVGGGGRYDGLVGRFRGESVPATGFSIGVSRLFSALKAIKSPIVTGAAVDGPVVVLVMDKDKTADYQRLVSDLRNANIPAEMYLGSAGMNAQLKYADKRGSRCAVIQGSNEREAGQVVIKDLVLGASLGGATKDRADYLELKQKAQFAVAEEDMVAAVREVMGRGR